MPAHSTKETIMPVDRELVKIQTVYRTADGNTYETFAEAVEAAKLLTLAEILLKCPSVYLSDRQAELVANCLNKEIDFALKPEELEIESEEHLPPELSPQFAEAAGFVDGLLMGGAGDLSRLEGEKE